MGNDSLLVVTASQPPERLKSPPLPDRQAALSDALYMITVDG